MLGLRLHPAVNGVRLPVKCSIHIHRVAESKMSGETQKLKSTTLDVRASLGVGTQYMSLSHTDSNSDVVKSVTRDCKMIDKRWVGWLDR